MFNNAFALQALKLKDKVFFLLPILMRLRNNLKFRNQTSFNHYKHSKYFLGQTIISPTTTYILYFFKIVLSSEPNPHFLFQTDTNLNSHKYSCVNSEILKKTTCISFILGQPPIKS